jgi:hypothetical protein
MRPPLVLVLVLVLVLDAGCSSSSGSAIPPSSSSTATAVAPTEATIAAAYAPDFYQDIASRHAGRADVPLRFDWDGTAATSDSWESLDAAAASPAAAAAMDWGAYIYYAVIETDTHWFVSYWVFHPQDWDNALGGCFGSDCHENDLEAVLVVVERDAADPASLGHLLLFETEAHGNFYQYASDPRVAPGGETIDGPVTPGASGRRPRVYVESKGHGIFAADAPITFGVYLGEPGRDFLGGDGFVFRFTGQAEDAFDPALGRDPSDPARRAVGYALLPLETTLWTWRGGPYAGAGPLDDVRPSWIGTRFSLGGPIGFRLDGDTHATDAVPAPWGQDDADDGPVASGDWFFDPAWAISRHLSVAGPFSLSYTRNAFLR